MITAPSLQSFSPWYSATSGENNRDEEDAFTLTGSPSSTKIWNLYFWTPESATGAIGPILKINEKRDSLNQGWFLRESHSCNSVYSPQGNPRNCWKSQSSIAIPCIPSTLTQSHVISYNHLKSYVFPCICTLCNPLKSLRISGAFLIQIFKNFFVIHVTFVVFSNLT